MISQRILFLALAFGCAAGDYRLVEPVGFSPSAALNFSLGFLLGSYSFKRWDGKLPASGGIRLAVPAGEVPDDAHRVYSSFRKGRTRASTTRGSRLRSTGIVQSQGT